MRAWDVIVVGGGAAGLAAMQSLHAAGREALLVEARGRLGGRIHTLPVPAWPAAVELGAEFVHGDGDGLEVALAPVADGEDWAWRSGGGLRPAEEFAGGADAVLERVQAFAGDDVSFAEFVRTRCRDLPDSAREGALGFVEGYEAADAERISVASLRREFAVEGEAAVWPRRPRGGYQQLVEPLRPAAERVWLNAPVRAVRWRRGEAVLTVEREGRAEHVTARAVIVTLPLAVLQHGDVRFDPPLEAKAGALQGLVMGPALRVVLRLRTRLWSTLRDGEGGSLEALRFLFSSGGGERGFFPTWWTDPRAPQITGWAAGPRATRLAGLSEDEIARIAVAELARRLGTGEASVRAELLEAHTHDWQADPYARGAYSYAAVGGMGAHAELAAPLEETLFFAGEATDATGHHATVQGAVASGRRAAEEVGALGAGVARGGGDGGRGNR